MDLKVPSSLHGPNDILFDEFGDDLRFLIRQAFDVFLEKPNFPPCVNGDGNDQDEARHEENLEY